MRMFTLLFLVLPFLSFADERFKVISDKMIKSSRDYVVIKDKKTKVCYIYNPKSCYSDMIFDDPVDYMIWNIPVRVKFKDGKMLDARTFLEKLTDKLE